MTSSKPNKFVTITAIALICSACSSTSGTGSTPAAQPVAAAAPKSDTRVVKSRDGTYTGEIVGTPAANSRFAKLQIGMSMNETQEILGRAPDRFHTYESGKRWIPFYFGNDARRLQALYKDEGCLIFTGGNVWGSAGGDLIQITADPSGACYQP
jgi:hypothetical protein